VTYWRVEQIYKCEKKLPQKCSLVLPHIQLFIVLLIVNMLNSAIIISALAGLFEVTEAHGFVTGIRAGSSWFKGSDPVWYYSPANSRPQTAGWDSLNQDLGFVEPNRMGSSDVNCHKSATAGRLYADVQAGQTIQIPWNTWPSDSHKGPIINYLAPCNGMCISSTCHVGYN
jgi:lytic cellulose monooxygenase (C1-hydroxylating)